MTINVHSGDDRGASHKQTCGERVSRLGGSRRASCGPNTTDRLGVTSDKKTARSRAWLPLAIRPQTSTTLRCKRVGQSLIHNRAISLLDADHVTTFRQEAPETCTRCAVVPVDLGNSEAIFRQPPLRNAHDATLTSILASQARRIARTVNHSVCCGEGTW